MMKRDVFRGLGVKIDILDERNFLKIKETLTRIGYASKKENKLYQSVHILHKQGEYAIIHFKELFVMDGKETDITENDIGRRNTIVHLLEDWGLVKIINPDEAIVVSGMNQIKIVAFADKKNWELIQKYNIGNVSSYSK